MTRLVYNSGPDASAPPCNRCGRSPCRCGAERGLSPADHDVRVRRERVGRKGKTVTVVGPFRLATKESRALLKRLKRACGSGGTAKPASPTGAMGWIDLEIQGDHAERVIEELAALGYPAKRSGG